MKHLSTLMLSFILLVSCQKDLDREHNQASYLDNVKEHLRDSLSAEDWNYLDFSRAVRTSVNGDSLHYLRVPFKDRSIETDFLLLQTDLQGNCTRGLFVSIYGKIEKGEERGWPAFQGGITWQTLKRTLTTHSHIEDGYITAFHVKKRAPELSLLAPAHPKEQVYEELPEVIIMGQASSGGGMSYSSWMSLGAMFGSGGGGSMGSDYGAHSGYYSEMNYNYSGGGSSGSSNNKGSSSSDTRSAGDAVYEEDAMVVDFERVESFPSIDIEKYLKCFAGVPDQGAACSIEIFTDIPVDKDPNKMFNWQTGSPGHTFLQIRKTNGSQAVVQNIGFYPEQSWKVTLTPAPISGKFADNGGHEFNASLKMDLTPAQMEAVLMEIRYKARFIKYDIDEYNCTDFALDVLNAARVNKLNIPLKHIPGGMAAGGTRTPQGLFNQLKAMKQSNGPEASNIDIPGVKGYVAYSSGACN